MQKQWEHVFQFERPAFPQGNVFEWLFVQHWSWQLSARDSTEVGLQIACHWHTEFTGKRHVMFHFICSYRLFGRECKRSMTPLDLFGSMHTVFHQDIHRCPGSCRCSAVHCRTSWPTSCTVDPWQVLWDGSMSFFQSLDWQKVLGLPCHASCAIHFMVLMGLMDVDTRMFWYCTILYQKNHESHEHSWIMTDIKSIICYVHAMITVEFINSAGLERCRPGCDRSPLLQPARPTYAAGDVQLVFGASGAENGGVQSTHHWFTP